MSDVSVSSIIAAPMDVVFNRASNFAQGPEVISAITQVEMLTDGPVGPGTRFRETRVVFGREATEEMEVGIFEPPHRYSLECENHGCRYHSELRFAEREAGTEVTMTFEATPLTFFAKIMSFLTKPLLKTMVKACAKDLEDLKTAIESG